MHEPTFRLAAASVGLNPYMLEMANIREHCSWVHTDRRAATEKAKDLIRVLVEKVKRNVPLKEIEVPVTQRVMVIGAGIAGIQAALDVAAAGYEVALVERNPSIGGFMSMLDETFPTLDCSQCILTPRMVEIMQSKKITLHTYSEVQQVDGYIGMLQDVQKEFGYLRGDAMAYLSEKSEVPLARLFAVANFYNAFSLEPRGRNIIRVCMGTACHLRGGGRIADAVARELDIEHGETTKDLLFTLERVNCLGTCALAPVVTVNDKYHGQMTIGKTMNIVEQCVEQEQKPTPEPELVGV
jgi:NADH:ubiquinone oxidoreductase subunit E